MSESDPVTEQALLLTDLDVSASMFDDDECDELLLGTCDIAHQVVVSHLRSAKSELMRMGVNLHWSER